MKDEEKKVISPADAGSRLRPESELPPDADVEERFNEFWKRNGIYIFGAIAAAAVAVLGYQIVQFFQNHRESGIQAAYSEVEGADGRISFAVSHQEHSLGGLAFLEAADEEYARGAYLEAASHYEAALKGLRGTPLEGRARLGMAIARLRQGDGTGSALLEDLARDASVLEVIRAQAAYHHAVSAWQAGDAAAAERSLSLLGSLNGAPEWQLAGERLAQEIPEGGPEAGGVAG